MAIQAQIPIPFIMKGIKSTIHKDNLTGLPSAEIGDNELNGLQFAIMETGQLAKMRN